jgi:hypothetical protein
MTAFIGRREFTSGELDAAFAAFSSWGPEALFVGPDPLFNTERAQLVDLAARHALPASYFQRDHVEGSGLARLCGFLSSGRHLRRSAPKRRETSRFAGAAADQIGAGDQPKDPKALALTIPPAFLARADEVIE